VLAVGAAADELNSGAGTATFGYLPREEGSALDEQPFSFGCPDEAVASLLIEEKEFASPAQRFFCCHPSTSMLARHVPQTGAQARRTDGEEGAEPRRHHAGAKRAHST
jgi:hypothetical protein